MKSMVHEYTTSLEGQWLVRGKYRYSDTPASIYLYYRQTDMYNTDHLSVNFIRIFLAYNCSFLVILLVYASTFFDILRHFDFYHFIIIWSLVASLLFLSERKDSYEITNICNKGTYENSNKLYIKDFRDIEFEDNVEQRRYTHPYTGISRTHCPTWTDKDKNRKK